MHHIFIIHSTVEGLLDCFHFLTILNWTAMSMTEQVSEEQDIKFSGICQGLVWSGHMVELYLAFENSSHLFPEWLYQFATPTVNEGSLFSTTLPAFGANRFCDLHHSEWVRMKSQSNLVLMSLMCKDVEHFSRYLLSIFISSFESTMFGFVALFCF